MIDPTNPAATRQATPTMPAGASSAKGPFDDALAAAARAQASLDAQASDLDSIRTKGFTAWARDTRIEKLKEELRRKVMSEMGLTDKDLAKVSDAVRQVLEQKIKEEVEKRLTALREQEDQKGDTKTTGGDSPQPGKATLVAAQETGQQADLPAAGEDACAPGKKDRLGKSCPVIPALATPGGESFF